MSKLFGSINTVQVPYIPEYDRDILPPEYFEKTIRDFKRLDLDIDDFELTEILGSRLLKIDGEWCAVGNIAKYTRKAPPKEQTNE